MKEEKKTKALKLRLTESLWHTLKAQAEGEQISINDAINLSLTASLKKQNVFFDEKVDKPEKKEIESRVYFTVSEADVLKSYAQSNNWSLSKEIRYRTVSSFSRKPKLNGEELKVIYTVRSSINVLGANLNRLVRNSELLSDSNIEICKELVFLMKDLKDKVSYLEKCSSTQFKLKGGDTNGRQG